MKRLRIILNVSIISVIIIILLFVNNVISQSDLINGALLGTMVSLVA